MSKPAQTAAWATLASYPDGVEVGTDTKTEPSADRKAEGWEPAAKPPAQHWNWWNNLVGQWTEYLNNGDLEGDHTIAGSLDISDALEVENDVTIVEGNLELVAGGIEVTEGSINLVGGELYHPERPCVQGFDGAVGGSYSLHATAGTASVAATTTLMIPMRAPFATHNPRIKALKILVENNTLPDLYLYVKTGPATFVSYVLGVTYSDASVAGTHTRRTATLDTPVVIDLDAGQRPFIAMFNNAGTSLICHELTTIWDSPKP